MDFSNRKFNYNSNLINDLYKREFDTSYNQTYQSKNVYSKNIISHLNLDSELHGHDGCVNCLEWNSTGTLLASGSDDLKVIIWDPFRKKLINTIDTKHRGNIFSVKFLPSTNDSLIASAAADRDIYVYDINKNLNLNEIHAHHNRVKKLATAQDQPFLFWSCGEDGLILQHDIRCASNKITSLLLNYAKNKYNISSNMEAKCIAINQSRSELVAIGGNDPFARLYDRRMIRLRTLNSRIGTASAASSSIVSSNVSKCLFEYSLEKNDLNKFNQKNTPCSFYVPGHLPKRIEEYRKRMKTLSVTHLAFSQNGTELLVNLGGEQLYLFDVLFNNKYENKYKYDSFRDLFTNSESDKECKYVNTSSSISSSSSSSSENLQAQFKEENKQKKKSKLPTKAENLKIKANLSFEQQNYVEAIEYYNQAIELVPASPILYGNRAASLMKRNWDGDTYTAMMDCYKALYLDSNHLKSHFRLSKCLFDLKWFKEADECIKIFSNKYPDYAKSHACENLISEINLALENLRKSEEKKKKMATKNRNEKIKQKKRENTFYRFLRTSYNNNIINNNHNNNNEEEQSDEESSDEDENGQDNDGERDSDLSQEEEDSSEENESSSIDSDDIVYQTDESTNENDEENSNEERTSSSKKRKCNSATHDKNNDIGSTSNDSNNNNINSNNNKINNNKNKNGSINKKSANKKKKAIKCLIQQYNKMKENACDFKSRFCGHCNVATDIKEASFIGDNFICAGSDDGSFFIWDKSTTNVVRVLKGDESIVNCIQPHPYSPMIATSGIDPYVRTWTPKFYDLESKSSKVEEQNERIVYDVKSAVLNNQLQMNSHPFEFLFLNLTQNAQNWDSEEDSNNNQQSVACRPS